MPDEAAAPAEVADATTTDQPNTEAPAEGGQGSADLANVFADENFDPTTLPDELQPAYKQMQAGLTRKFQEVGQQRSEFEQNQEQYDQINELLEATFSGDEDAAQELAELYGVEQEAEPGDNPEVSQIKREMEKLSQKFEKQEQEQQEAREVSQIRSSLEQLTGRPVTGDADPEQDAVVAFAVFDRNGDKPLGHDDLKRGQQAAKKYAAWAVEQHLNGVREGNNTADASNLNGSVGAAASADGAPLGDRLMANLAARAGL